LSGASTSAGTRAYTTRQSRRISDSLLVTHPFHPLKGQSLVVLFTQRRRHGLFFVCEVDGRRRITVAQDWTGRGVAASSDRLAVDGLSAARALIDKIDPMLAVANSHVKAQVGQAHPRPGGERVRTRPMPGSTPSARPGKHARSCPCCAALKMPTSASLVVPIWGA
jgi:hypothetical protein